MNKNNIHVLSRAVVLDKNYILLCKTLGLSSNFYFLPGGHIEYGETAEVAVLRELLEESGAEGKVKRFLGCLEYSFELGYNSICHNHEYNFIFEIESKFLKNENIIPRLEDHIELMWAPLININMIDFRPEPLKKLIPLWLDSKMHSAFQSKIKLLDKLA